jgi:hypothetical protein
MTLGLVQRLPELTAGVAHRNRIMRFVSILLLLASCTSAATSAEQGIRAQYDVLERAFAAADLAAILATRDPAFEVFGPQGQHDDFERMAEYARQWFVTNKPPVVVRFTIESVEHLSGNEVAVRVLQRASRYQEREGKLRRVEHEVRQRETWIRTPAGWRVRKVDEIDLANRKGWIDGELEQPQL